MNKKGFTLYFSYFRQLMQLGCKAKPFWSLEPNSLGLKQFYLQSKDAGIGIE
jgi:hypothetical protein